MSRGRRLDWRAIGGGAVLALAVIAATMVLVQALDSAVGIDRSSNVVFIFYALALAGEGAGGWYAASRRPDAALLHGVLAAMVAYGVVAVFGAILRVTLDKGPEPVALAFNGLTAASAAILGTLVAERRPRRSAP